MECNGAEWNGMECNGAEWSGAECNGAEWNGARTPDNNKKVLVSYTQYFLLPSIVSPSPCVVPPRRVVVVV
jgi:hypothetical protein